MALKRHVPGPAKLTFGRTLRELRKSRRRTIRDCADALHISRPVWNEVELGHHDPFEHHQLRIICSTLQLSPEEFVRLVAAAATTNGCIRLGVSNLSTEQRALAARLVEEWASLTREQIRALRGVLDGS